MSDYRRPQPEEVEHLLRNAQLRDALEPYFDEAIEAVNVAELPTPVENEYLASMLAWERAPIIPIANWFEPELILSRPEILSDDELHHALWTTIYKLFDKRIVLDFTDHLSDRQLYCLIYRDILPSPEKKLDGTHNYLHWDCCNAGSDPELWLRHYASEEDRQLWIDDLNCPMPPHIEPPHVRDLPRSDL